MTGYSWWEPLWFIEREAKPCIRCKAVTIGGWGGRDFPPQTVRMEGGHLHTPPMGIELHQMANEHRVVPLCAWCRPEAIPRRGADTVRVIINQRTLKRSYEND